MQPAGPPARVIAQLGWVFIILGSIIFLVVMAYLIYALVRRRPEDELRWADTRIVIIGGMIIPAAILLVLFVMNTHAQGQVSAPASPPELEITVTGRQWWWEIHYGEQQFETANEIHIPVGQPVLLRLVSEDVIHSFWVPELHGKMDLIPGRVNDFWIEADQPGIYLGKCAEYCGTQHAKMRFYVVAEEEEQFNAWLARMQEPSVAPQQDGIERGQQVFLSAGCIECHAVEGTEATGNLGPDLTHFASRRSIGAGSAPLNRGNLAGWVADPQSIKPGAFMPPSNLTGADLNAVVDYLMSLQ